MIPPPIDPPPIDPPLSLRRAQVNRTETDALLVAAGRGDLDAFTTFYDRTVRVVFALLHQDLGPRAELATAQVYLHLWRTAAGFDPAVRSAYATLLLTACRALAGLRCTACRPAHRRDPRRPALTTPPQTPPIGPRQDRREPYRAAVCPTASYR